MSDLISRQAAIEALSMCQTYLFHTYNPDEKISLESAVYELEQLPSAQPEQLWIPCSERLPEMGSTVLMQNTGGWMFVATYAVTPKRKYWAVLGHDYALDEAIAWMPLPEPYKGGEKDG